MQDTEFDHAFVAAAFEQAALVGWRDLSLAEAGRVAGLPLDRVRARFPGRGALLLRFGVLLDQAALAMPAQPEEGPQDTPRELLFDMLMRRFDAMQPHRDGLLALLQVLPGEPTQAALLYDANLRSMRWMLDGAGVPTAGLAGVLRVHGLLALWLNALRAWQRDDGPDLPATMAAVDRGLERALRAEGWLPGRGASPVPGDAGPFAGGGMPAMDAVPIEDLSTAEAMDAALGPARGGPPSGDPSGGGAADGAPGGGASAPEDAADGDPARKDADPKLTPPHLPPTGDT